ncbi:hypothetical protein ACFOZ1_06670 [Gracilibacillus marinus]|uniref:Uncharacterized protein n=1 Tax=Gracilibacillus marinus TaxID=630535 RepID=A0ABV8VU44_9BACI
MDQKKVLRTVSKLLEAKEKVQENIKRIEDGTIKDIYSLKATDPRYRDNYVIFGYHDQWINKERFFNKIKYLILAEMKETLDEINVEIDKLVTFKGEEL